MKIEKSDLPYTGEPFQFAVTEAIGVTKVHVYVNAKHLFETECPDPPCHELAVQVPLGTKGSALRIVAIDSLGNRAVESFRITESRPDKLTSRF